MKVSRLAIVLACVKLSFVNCYYSDCGSNVGSIIAVSIPGCDNEKICILKSGTNVTVEIDFETDVDSNAITAIVFAATINVLLPLDLPNPDGCKDSGIQCPISKGQRYKYIGSLPILSKYVKIRTEIQWHLTDKYQRDIVCLLIPAKFQ